LLHVHLTATLTTFLLSAAAFAEPVVIDIDLSTPRGEVDWKANGLLHSMTADEPADFFVTPLRLKLWRGAASKLDDRLYKRAYVAARRKDPKALLGEPSLSALDWSLAQARIEQFLDYCERYSLSPVYLTWHEFGDEQVEAIPRHVAEVRQLAARYPLGAISKGLPPT